MPQVRPLQTKLDAISLWDHLLAQNSQPSQVENAPRN
jgi:hypothetical protein